jgi:2-(1,2-epoxy-1,2-dihydrophenyl)acetyl-CoA isomerase
LLNLARADFVWQFATLTTPTVAALWGPTYGAGALIATSLDLRVAGPNTVFKFSAGQYGGANLTWSLPLLIGWSHAKDALLTARPIAADEASRIGLINRLVAEDAVLGSALDVASTIASHPPNGLREIKQLMHEGVGLKWREMYDAENTLALTTLHSGSARTNFASFLGKHPGS